MAKLASTPYPFPKEEDYGKDFMEYIKASQKALDAIPEDRLYSHPYADGNAYYYVVSFKPLVLQHVPFLDAWHLNAAHISWLTAKTVKGSIQNDIAIRKLFASK